MIPRNAIGRGALLTMAAALLCCSLHAQPHPAPTQGAPPDVHTLAQRVDQHYNKLHSLKAEFTQTYAGLGMHRQESGTVLLLKPGRVRWDYSAPPGKVFLIDGKYAWFYAPGDAQVQRMEAKKLDDLQSPLRLLLGHTQLEKELTHITIKPAPNGAFILTGQAKGQEQRIARVSLTVTGDGAITKIEIEEVDGAITGFTFTGETPNAPVPQGAFHFTAPAGIPVIDAMPPV